jgi:hypothetical protein
MKPTDVFPCACLAHMAIRILEYAMMFVSSAGVLDPTTPQSTRGLMMPPISALNDALVTPLPTTPQSGV